MERKEAKGLLVHLVCLDSLDLEERQDKLEVLDHLGSKDYLSVFE